MLVFDAPNVPTAKLFALAKAARNRGAMLRIVIPATAHTERLLHNRQHFGASYDADQVRRALEDVVDILPLDGTTAELCAERLSGWFPTRDEWQDAKWRKIFGERPRGRNQRVSATVDWYTAALCPPGAIVVTSDQDTEFRGCEVIRPGALEEVLREMGRDG